MKIQLLLLILLSSLAIAKEPYAQTTHNLTCMTASAKGSTCKVEVFWPRSWKGWEYSSVCSSTERKLAVTDIEQHEKSITVQMKSMEEGPQQAEIHCYSVIYSSCKKTGCESYEDKNPFPQHRRGAK